MKRSKAYRQAAELVDRERLYSPLEAAELAKKTSPPKMDATVEVAMRLGVDPRKADQMVRGTVNLPHGTGKTARVIVFAVGDKATEAEAAGADAVGSDDLIARIQGGWLDFDAAIATPDQMAKVGRIARILGPRGLMPNPKTGTVTPDVSKAVADIKGGKINYRVDKAANLHLVIGKVSFPTEKLVENYAAALDEVLRAKPSAAKGRYLKKVARGPRCPSAGPLPPLRPRRRWSRSCRSRGTRGCTSSSPAIPRTGSPSCSAMASMKRSCCGSTPTGVHASRPTRGCARSGTAHTPRTALDSGAPRGRHAGAGSGAWIRTMIRGFKVPRPALRRHRKGGPLGARGASYSPISRVSHPLRRGPRARIFLPGRYSRAERREPAAMLARSVSLPAPRARRKWKISPRRVYRRSRGGAGRWRARRRAKPSFVARLVARDESAFNELVITYERRVFALVFRMLGRRDEAEDLAQEVFVQVFKAIDQFRGDSKLSTWIYRIAVNLCKNRSKYLSRRHAGEQDDVDAMAERAAVLGGQGRERRRREPARRARRGHAARDGGQARHRPDRARVPRGAHPARRGGPVLRGDRAVTGLAGRHGEEPDPPRARAAPRAGREGDGRESEERANERRGEESGRARRAAERDEPAGAARSDRRGARATTMRAELDDEMAGVLDEVDMRDLLRSALAPPPGAVAPELLPRRAAQAPHALARQVLRRRLEHRAVAALDVPRHQHADAAC